MALTHFGFESVDEQQKAQHVRGVFDSVAPRYDLMNDLMSAGLHRVWKRYAIEVANPQPGQRVLDIAAGTGDLSLALARKVGPSGLVLHTDINETMLRQGRNRLLDQGLVLPSLVCDAEHLPFADNAFDLVCVAFGLRNMTHKDRALSQMQRVLKPGGKLLVLEFSKVLPPLEKGHEWYTFNIVPKLGRLVANDEASYRYLAQSIRMHPSQQALRQMMKLAGFGHVDVHNLTAGVVALHVGIKC